MGDGAIATKDVPPNVSVADTPARVVAENVGWERELPEAATG